MLHTHTIHPYTSDFLIYKARLRIGHNARAGRVLNTLCPTFCHFLGYNANKKNPLISWAIFTSYLRTVFANKKNVFILRVIFVFYLRCARFFQKKRVQTFLCPLFDTQLKKPRWKTRWKTIGAILFF